MLSETTSRESTAGVGGTITIDVDKINLNHAQISTTTRGLGDAGDIIIGSAAELSLGEDNQLIFNPGILTKVSQLILNTSSIESASKLDDPQAGRAGTIKIAVTDEVRLRNNAILSTSAANSKNDISEINAENATILIQAPNLVYLIDSKITTSVIGGNSPGGNIASTLNFFILNNSSITANAFGGPGGNISIVADNFFQSSDSIVTASSQKGIDGQINISSPDIDLSASLINLPQNYLKADAWVIEKCEVRTGETNSRFIETRRKGIRRLPQDLWPSQQL